MNKEQFERLQSAVQWSLDEHLRKTGKMPAAAVPTLAHEQGAWALGTVNGEVPTLPGWRYLKIDCNTACCIAGNIVAEAGGSFVTAFGVEGQESVSSDYCIPKGETAYRSISDYAVELLGTDYSSFSNKGDDLFDGDNRIEDIIRIASDIASDHGFELALVNMDLLYVNDPQAALAAQPF